MPQYVVCLSVRLFICLSVTLCTFPSLSFPFLSFSQRKYTNFLANFRILIAISPFVDQSSPTLLGIHAVAYMYGSDRSLQRRFPIDDSLFQSGDICNKVAK